MGKPPQILVDMDDVLVDWRGELIRRAVAVTGMSQLLDGNTWTSPDIFLCVKELCSEDAVWDMYEIVGQPNFHRDLPWIPGGKEALEEMLGLGLEVCIVTWPWQGHDTCGSEKYAAIRDHLGGEWESRTIQTMRKAAVRGEVLIDDKPGAATFDKYPPTWKHVMFDGSPVPMSKFALHPPELRLDCWANWKKVILPLLLA